MIELIGLVLSLYPHGNRSFEYAVLLKLQTFTGCKVKAFLLWGYFTVKGCFVCNYFLNYLVLKLLKQDFALATWKWNSYSSLKLMKKKLKASFTFKCCIHSMWRLKDARENGGGRMKLSGGSTGMWDSRRHPDADSPQVTFHVAIYGLQNINQSHWGNALNLNSTISLVLWFRLHITCRSALFSQHMYM